MYSSILFLLRMCVVVDIFQDDEDKENIINLEAICYSDEVLKTDKKKCVVCGVGDVMKVPNKNYDMLVFGRQGLRKVKQEEYRCNFRNKDVPCRAGYYHGYTTHQGMRIYDDEVLKNKVLVISSQSAFEIDYLVEIVSDVELFAAGFETCAKKFNRYHNFNLPHDTLEKRALLYKKRVSNAYFLFTYLECCQRYEIPNYQIIRTSLDAAILEHKEELIQAFRSRWTLGHKCEKRGCQSCLVIDAGLKPFRKLCGAKLNGIREFKASEDFIITGCTSIPQPNKKFCQQHEDGESPVIPVDQVASETRRVLRDRRKRTANYKEAGQDDIFVVESIEGIKKDKNGQTKYQVKWVGFDHEDCTWEGENAIPKFIREYYEDRSKLKSKLPNPVIKSSKTLANGSKYHYLSWGGGKGGKWLSQDWFEIANEDGDLTSTVEVNSCNTRKSRDKRERRHTVGIFLGSYPCGIIGLWDEVYGSESISQVYSIVLEYLSSTRHNVRTILYDDACHLVRYAKNESERNKECKAMSQIPMYVDKFHFRNHIDPWCIENCDPTKIKDLDDINTPICEQLFKKINRHTNCKSMNEPRYFMFWMYNLDIHNLDVDGLDSCLPDPRSEFRWSQINILKVNFENLPQKQNVETLTDQLAKVDLEDSSASSLSVESRYSCEICKAGYKSEGYLNKHMIEKHGLGGNKMMECSECGSFLSSKQALERHILKVHRVCKICKVELKSATEKNDHQRIHSTCDVCGTFFPTVSKLERHKKQVHM